MKNVVSALFVAYALSAAVSMAAEANQPHRVLNRRSRASNLLLERSLPRRRRRPLHRNSILQVRSDRLRLLRTTR